MAKIKVRYTVLYEQEIDWPDDELGDFSCENLACNLETDKSRELALEDILSVKKDGEIHQF